MGLMFWHFFGFVFLHSHLGLPSTIIVHSTIPFPNLLFVCFYLKSSTPDVAFKWYKSGTEIRQSEKYRIVSHHTSSSLELLNPVKADSGEYTCKASNQHGTDSCTASLIVTGKIPKGPHLNYCLFLMVVFLNLLNFLCALPALHRDVPTSICIKTRPNDFICGKTSCVPVLTYWILAYGSCLAQGQHNNFL
uniref:Ig-like domain-containing protein n=1 Tax=Astatotilapia calliptera TaxID=8154 RepID=A0A3P8NZU0_ASTCA